MAETKWLGSFRGRRCLSGLLRRERSPKRAGLRAERNDYGRCDIQVLDESWNVVETNEDLKPVI